MPLNTVGLGNPTTRTCATCHGMHLTGMDAANGWMDIGTANFLGRAKRRLTRGTTSAS